MNPSACRHFLYAGLRSGSVENVTANGNPLFGAAVMHAACMEVYLVAGNDVVSRLDAGHTLTYALHNAGRLVAQDAREQTLRVCANVA